MIRCASPDLARPAGRQLAGPRQGEALLAAQLLGQGAGQARRAVAAVVVDQDDVEGPGIVLAQQSLEAVLDDLGLVARRHQGDHRGPGLRLLQVLLELLVGQPEAAAQGDQVKPDQQRQKAERRKEQGHGIAPSAWADA
jgi:hypothetical protein